MVRKKQPERIREVAAIYDGLGSELYQAANLLEKTSRINLQNKMMSMERQAESATVKLRSITARLVELDTTAVYSEVAGVLGIAVEECNDWLKITVPAILPKKYSKDNVTFLMRPLRHALVEFQRENTLPRFGECVICIVHCYDVALGENRVRDYDNIETKRYLDVIEAAFLTNDSGRLCTVLQTTAMAEKDRTIFYVMPPHRLQKWVEKQWGEDTRNV